MNVMNITRCPSSPEMFRNRGKELGCSVGKEYHCMMNEKKRHVELCISRSWIQPDHCPEYNTAANRIDVSACDASDGVCPPTIYWSNTSFQYSGCLPEQGTTNTTNPDKDSNDILVISVVTVVSLVIICIVCAVLFVVCRRKRRGSRGADSTVESTHIAEVELPTFPEQKLDHEIPPSCKIEEQIKRGREAIEEHRADSTYIATHAAENGKRILDEKKILLLLGITGSGKTKTALQIASEWMREDETSRNCVYLKSFDDPLSGKLHYETCIILDGCFTRWVLDSSSTSFSRFLFRLYKQIKDHRLIYLIITVHESIYSTHRNMLQKYDLFSNEHHLNIQYEDNREKEKILTSHLKHTEHALVENELKGLLSSCSRAVGFPSMCWMYSNIPGCQKEGDKFFRSCEYILPPFIETMEDSLKCCLYYAMLRSKYGEIDTRTIDEECLKDIVKEYKCDKMRGKQLLDCFEKEKKYFSSGREKGVFSFSQTVIYETCLKIWLKAKKELLLKLCSVELLKESIRAQNYKEIESSVYIRIIKEKEFPRFAARFLSLMKEHRELEVHSLLKNETFLRHVDNERRKIINQSVIQQEISDKHLRDENVEWKERPLLHKEKFPNEEEEPQQDEETEQASLPLMQNDPRTEVGNIEPDYQNDSPMKNLLSVNE